MRTMRTVLTTPRNAVALMLLLAGVAPGCDDDTSPTPPQDSTPPGRVADLAATVTRGRGVHLTWTAPGDDGARGRAQTYDLRYAEAPVTEATWDSATSSIDVPEPNEAGASESVVVSGLAKGTWYFALRSADEVPNWSELSNVASFSSLPVAEFSLVDVNATSPRFDDPVSPRDYLKRVSAWYFGHAT